MVQVCGRKIPVWRIIFVRFLLSVKFCFRWFTDISRNQKWQSRPNQKIFVYLCNLGIALTDTDGHKNIWIQGQGFMCFREITVLWRRKWVMPEVVTADTITVLRTVERADRSLRKWVAEVGESGRQICRNCRLWSMWEWASVFMEPKDLSKRIVSPVKNYTI